MTFSMTEKVNGKIYYDKTTKLLPFNTDDCLIEVTLWTGLTVLSSIETG
jgi:hypothetical protein